MSRAILHLSVNRYAHEAVLVCHVREAERELPAAVDGGWQLTLGLADMDDQNGLVSVPIDGAV